MAFTEYFLEPRFISWFWILVPFFILYLIKPKPINQTIPSLMFLMQDKGRAFRNSFLRYLYRDFVFFLQLLILLLLVAAACQPFINVNKTTLLSNTVIVLDASASMQTDDGRWEDALDLARESLSRQNTIILVGNRPIIAGAEVTRDEADEILSSLEPLDTETNLYAAVIAAREYATDADSTVLVISDFRNTDVQQDYSAALATIQATGAIVRIEQVGGAAQNVGIVSLDAKEDKTRVGITNFNAEATAVTLKAGSLEQTVPLGAGSTDYVTINTPAGVTEVTIDASDDFELDNKAYLANNPNLDVRMLIITNDNDVRESPFWYALQSINDKTPLELSIEVASPPTLVDIDHDIIVFYHVDSTLLVQRTVRETAAAVRGGSAAIIMYQDDLFGINFEGMLPYEYVARGGASGVTPGDLSPIVQDIEFGDVQQYFILKGSSRVLAQATADDSPIIGLIPYGGGRVLYYGIDDDTSTFPLEPYYPVFWKRALDELGGRVSIADLNQPTGARLLGVTEKPSEVPGDLEFQGFLDKQGIYVFSDRAVAANLLNQEESRVAVEPLSEDLSESLQLGAADNKKQKELTSLFILVALALLLLELFIVKFRGDF
jgi:hypothetical protein